MCTSQINSSVVRGHALSILNLNWLHSFTLALYHQRVTTPIRCPWARFKDFHIAAAATEPPES